MGESDHGPEGFLNRVMFVAFLQDGDICIRWHALHSREMSCLAFRRVDFYLEYGYGRDQARTIAGLGLLQAVVGSVDQVMSAVFAHDRTHLLFGSSEDNSV